MSPTLAASIDALCFRWPGSDSAVLADVSLRLVRGSVTAVLGPSGAGKSTLLRLVAGLLPASSGSIEIADGEGVPVAMVFQDPRLLPWLTVRGNLGFALDAVGVPQSDHEARWRPLLEQVGLPEVADMRPAELSGGMAQRVGVVRALALRPRLLLLDEPLAAVDSLLRDRLQGMLSRVLLETASTALIVTHDVCEAAVLADTAVVLAGRPATVREVIQISVDHPRDILDPGVTEAARAVRSALWSVNKQT